MADSFLKSLTRIMTGGIPRWSLQGGFTSQNPTAGIGYAVGAGGAVGQLVNKAQGVQIDRPTGEITMDAANLNAGASVAFVLTDAAIALLDFVNVVHISGGTLGSYIITAIAAAGSATITVTNRTAGNLAEAIVLKFVVLKSANT